MLLLNELLIIGFLILFLGLYLELLLFWGVLVEGWVDRRGFLILLLLLLLDDMLMIDCLRLEFLDILKFNKGLLLEGLKGVLFGEIMEL